MSVPPVLPKSPLDTWQTCPLPILLSRIQRLSRAALYCRGQAADLREQTITERDRLILIYTSRITSK